MKLSKIATAGISIAVAGSLFTAIPAFAAAYTPDTNIVIGPNSGFWAWNHSDSWDINTASNSLWAPGRFLTGDNLGIWDSNHVKLYGSDNSSHAILGCSSGQDLVTATDGSSDQILTCDSQGINNGDGNLDVSVESRFYSDGQTWRERITITNPGATAVSGQAIDAFADAWSDSRTALSWSNTQGATSNWTTDYNTIPTAVVLPADISWITDDRTYDPSVYPYPAPVTKYALAGPGASVLPADDATRGFVSGGLGNANDINNTYFELPDIAAGQTVQIIFVYKAYLFDPIMTAESPMNSFQTGTYNAVQAAIADTAMSSDSVVFAGVTNPEQVLNWKHTSAPTPTPQLAVTGFDSTQTIWIVSSGVFAMAVGVLMAFWGRRKNKLTQK